MKIEEISETLSVSDKESVDIFCLSACITKFLTLYDTSVPFEKNQKGVASYQFSVLPFNEG